MAVVLACATFPLIWVGGLVTTYDAGMAVPDWPSTYGHNLILYPWSTWVAGPWDLFIEHGHRLLGAAVGMLVICLVIITFRCESRWWLRWYSLVLLVAVIGQGVLGGLRVLLNQRLLARVHACTGPLFFALAVAMAIATSNWWRQVGRDSSGSGQVSGHFQRLGIITAVLAYVQLVLGAHLRHTTFDMSPLVFRAVVVFHVLVAVALVAQGVLLAIRAHKESVLRKTSLMFFTLVAFQFALGLASWVVKYGWPAGITWPPGVALGFVVQAQGFLQATIVTAHVATGSLILVTSMAVALCGSRLRYASMGPLVLPAFCVEAVV